MTAQSITCDVFAERLPDFLEHEVDELTGAAMEAHALGCLDCGALLADIRRLRVDAANLPPLQPSRDLWAGIAARIEAPVVELTTRAARMDAIAAKGADARLVRGGSRSVRQLDRWLWTSAAAAALIVVSVGTTYVAMRGRPQVQRPQQIVANTVKPATEPESVTSVPPTPPQQNSATAPASAHPEGSSAPAAERSMRPLVRAVSSRAAAKPTAEEVYGREIGRLRLILAQRRSSLDTATVAVIERNLRVIDDAIMQCRAALAKDPASRFLLQSLNSALETKVELLRTAAQLPSHS